MGGRGLGQEIDAHDEVVRFNEIVGSKLLPNETGTKTSVHVMCSKVAPLQDPAVLEIDLETNTMWRSYCGRMHSGGEFANITDKPLLNNDEEPENFMCGLRICSECP